MKKILIFLTFMLFIPFIVNAKEVPYNAIVTKTEGIPIYTDEYGDPEVVSTLEYEAIVYITEEISGGRARIDGYDDHSFIYLNDVRPIDEIPEPIIEPEPEEKNEPQSDLPSRSHTSDYVITLIVLLAIAGIIVFYKKYNQKNGAY